MGRMYYIHNKNNRLINEHLVIYKQIISFMIAAKNETLCGDIDKIIIAIAPTIQPNDVLILSLFFLIEIIK